MWNPLSWVMEAAAIMAIALANGGVSIGFFFFFFFLCNVTIFLAVKQFEFRCGFG